MLTTTKDRTTYCRFKFLSCDDFFWRNNIAAI